MKIYYLKALSLINDYIAETQLDMNRLIGYEISKKYYEIINAVKQRGCGFKLQNNNIYLQFSIGNKRGQYSCNEVISKDGCINALAKSLAVIEHLKKFDKVSEFWSWYDENIREIKSIKNDITTVRQAIEKVKENYFQGIYNGIKRNDPEFIICSQGKYDNGYGRTYEKLEPVLDQQLTAELLIKFLEDNWSHLRKNHTKGFKMHYGNCQKLLIQSKLSDELKKFKEHFGRIETIPQLQLQEFSMSEFLELRKVVLENSKNEKIYDARIRVFNTLSINLIYGLRAHEFWAIKNLNNPITIGDTTYPAISDPNNKDKTMFLDNYYILTDSEGYTHKITVKTGGRPIVPYVHPDYPDLFNDLGLNQFIKTYSPVPNHNSKPRTIKECCTKWLISSLSKYSKIPNIPKKFTQTHSLRHLANLHGTLLGFTVDQRSKNLGHSETMNTKYNKHRSIETEIQFLKAEISNENKLKKENNELKKQIKTLEEENLFLKKRITELEIRIKQLEGGDDNITKLF